jgi:hypothetical protein
LEEAYMSTSSVIDIPDTLPGTIECPAASRIERLSEDAYDHLLREIGDCTSEVEWYEIAMAVTDRLRKLIVQSRAKHKFFVARPGLAEEQPCPGSLSPKTRQQLRRTNRPDRRAVR